MLRKTRLDTLAVCLLLGCCLFWGLQQVLIKATLRELPPIFQASLRLAGATALVWLWSAWRGIAL
ncbi:MAG: EamA/RhaT family transporter, partial [Polaromonas sp.]|nr:EamA/RhaT family transporter [Polaromonas sp.]